MVEFPSRFSLLASKYLPPMAQLDKTDAIRQKEARIAELEKEIASRRRVIKSLRTRLEKLQVSIRGMQSNIFNKMVSLTERVLQLQQELKDLLEQVMAHKKILKNKDLRAGAQEMYEALADEDDLMDQVREAQAERAEFNPEDFADEEGEAHKQDPFEEFRPEVSKEEQRSIRKVYLRLSQAFHPDRARTPEEAERNHRMMQQITAAYQKHDAETLLRMERQYLDEEFDPETVEIEDRPSLLDSRIERLERELDFLTQQKERLSEEIKNTRQSEVGKALTEYDRGNREGYGFDAQNREFEQEMQAMEQMRDTLRAALEAGKMTPELEEMLEPQEPDLDELMEMVFGPGGAPEGMSELAKSILFEDEDEDEPTTDFEVGQIVGFEGLERKIFPPDARGLIMEITPDFQVGYVQIGVLPDARVMARLGEDVVNDWIETISQLPLIYLMDDENLTELPRKKQKHFDRDAAMTIGRRRLYQKLFSQKQFYFNSDQIERLSKILLDQPQLSDGDCWLRYFQAHPWPKGLSGKILRNPFTPAPRKLVKILGVEQYDEEDGLIMAFSMGNQHDLIPLTYLQVKSPPPELAMALEDYEAWAEWRLTGSG